ncbi:tripartite tricarboxylate transporter TctB family protein [Nocardioides sp. BGMRC 2183]|nr:tripartite tricarboxylate transporter TctB family protein [Nocardioides sp. BGMRC 2183]
MPRRDDVGNVPVELCDHDQTRLSLVFRSGLCTIQTMSITSRGEARLVAGELAPADAADAAVEAAGPGGAEMSRTPSGSPRIRRLARVAPVARVVPELAGIVLVAVLLVQTSSLTTRAGGPGPAFFPRVVLVLLAVGLVVSIYQRLRPAAPSPGTTEEPLATEESTEWSATISWPRFWVGAVITVGYVVGASQVGWIPATAVFLVVFLRAAGVRRWWLTIPVSIAVTVGLAYVFLAVVYVSLPTGVGVMDELNTHFLDVVGIY